MHFVGKLWILSACQSSSISNSFRIQSCLDPERFFLDPDPDQAGSGSTTLEESISTFKQHLQSTRNIPLTPYAPALAAISWHTHTISSVLRIRDPGSDAFLTPGSRIRNPQHWISWMSNLQGLSGMLAFVLLSTLVRHCTWRRGKWYLPINGRT